MTSSSANNDKPAPWGRILVALATGVGIVALAYVSKRVLATPMRPALFAAPPLLMSLYEMTVRRLKNRPLASPVLWSVVIVAVTLLIILLQVS